MNRMAGGVAAASALFVIVVAVAAVRLSSASSAESPLDVETGSGRVTVEGISETAPAESVNTESDACRATTFSELGGRGQGRDYDRGSHDLRSTGEGRIASIQVSSCTATVCGWSSTIGSCFNLPAGDHDLDAEIRGQVGFLSLTDAAPATSVPVVIGAGSRADEAPAATDAAAPASTNTTDRAASTDPTRVPSSDTDSSSDTATGNAGAGQIDTTATPSATTTTAAPAAVNSGSCTITATEGRDVRLAVSGAASRARVARVGTNVVLIPRADGSVLDLNVPPGRWFYDLVLDGVPVAGCGATLVFQPSESTTSTVPAVVTTIPPTTTSTTPPVTVPVVVASTTPEPAPTPATDPKPAITNPSTCTVAMVGGRPQVEWSGAIAATSYRIWRNGEAITQVVAQRYTDRRATTPDTIYHYAVVNGGLADDTRVYCGSVRTNPAPVQVTVAPEAADGGALPPGSACFAWIDAFDPALVWISVSRAPVGAQVVRRNNRIPVEGGGEYTTVSDRPNPGRYQYSLEFEGDRLSCGRIIVGP